MKTYASDNSLVNHFRSIFLLGANTATYKFALAKSLLELHRTAKTFISLDELSPIYAKHLIEHIKTEKRQLSGSGTSKLLNSLHLYSQDQISEDLMLSITRAEGFKYVLDAFHNLPNKQKASYFFEKSVQGKKQGIVLTDNLFKIYQSTDFDSFESEIEGRWNLVESAWSEDQLIKVQYDTDTEKLYYLKPVSNNSFLHSHLRTDLTPVRKPLNGYQKGKCFYCLKHISIEPKQGNTCDVDHVIPMSIQYGSKYDLQLNHVWNLVLACQQCNRWEEGGKSANLPQVQFMHRLHQRNEYLIESNHPLKENIIQMAGKKSEQRLDFILKHFEFACTIRKANWAPKEVHATSF